MNRRVCLLPLGVIGHKQEEQHEDNEKHNGPLRVLSENMHRDNLLQIRLGAAIRGYSPVDAKDD